MGDEPEPLTSAECDLRELPSFLFDVRRFRDSTFVNQAAPEAVVAGWLLLAASWHQVPAASLPDDDAVLANFANYGRAIKVWKRIRGEALHGWVRCTDGRLYHPLLAAKARHAWIEAFKYRHGRFQDMVRQHNARDRDKNSSQNQLQSLSFDAWMTLGRPKTIAEFEEAITHDDRRA